MEPQRRCGDAGIEIEVDRMWKTCARKRCWRWGIGLLRRFTYIIQALSKFGQSSGLDGGGEKFLIRGLGKLNNFNICDTTCRLFRYRTAQDGPYGENLGWG